MNLQTLKVMNPLLQSSAMPRDILAVSTSGQYETNAVIPPKPLDCTLQSVGRFMYLS